MKVVLIHIPKTAGSTLFHVLGQRFAAGRSLFLGEMHYDPVIDQEQCDFIAGHMRLDFIRRKGLECFQKIVYFRDPVERAISQFYFMKLDAILKHYENPAIAMEDADRANSIAVLQKARSSTLEEFLDRHWDVAAEYLGNLHTWSLSEGGNRVADLTEADVRRAVTELDSMYMVGLVERFQESADLLFRKMGWPRGQVKESRNENKGRPSTASHDEATIDKIKKLCHLDITLYEAAKKVFERQLQENQPAEVRFRDFDRFTPAQPIHGEGWYSREKAGESWFVWSGPAPVSCLEIATKRGAKSRLQIVIRRFIKNSLINKLSVFINGKKWTYKKIRGKMITLYGEIGEELLAGSSGRLRFEFVLPNTMMPASLFAKSTDHRMLGFALEQIEVLPAN